MIYYWTGYFPNFEMKITLSQVLRWGTHVMVAMKTLCQLWSAVQTLIVTRWARHLPDGRIEEYLSCKLLLSICICLPVRNVSKRIYSCIQIYFAFNEEGAGAAVLRRGLESMGLTLWTSQGWGTMCVPHLWGRAWCLVVATKQLFTKPSWRLKTHPQQ